MAAPQELEGAPAAEVSSRVDTVAVILADDPVMSEQLQPLLAALRNFGKPVHVEGIVDEQWHPIDTSPRRSWRELRVGLQLADRRGPVGEEDVERFNRTIADFAAAVNAVSQREAPAAAAARARELDAFCADTDVEVAVNVIGQLGATFAVARVKALALDNGLSETGAGVSCPGAVPDSMTRRNCARVFARNSCSSRSNSTEKRPSGCHIASLMCNRNNSRSKSSG